MQITGTGEAPPAPCPAGALLPAGDSVPDCGGTRTDDVVAAALRHIAESTAARGTGRAAGAVDADTVGQALVHTLGHPGAERPRIARAIRELTPWAAREAAARIRTWIGDPSQSPEARSPEAARRGPDDMLEDVIALAILDADARPEASSRYWAANSHRAFAVHEWYARISPAHRAEAAARLMDEGLARPGGIVVPAMVVARVNALIDLGPDQLPRVRELLDRIFADGSTSGAIRQPLASVGPVYLHETIIAALRSLTLDPDRYLPDRGGAEGDPLVAELAAMPEYRDLLVTALENIAANTRATMAVRWRATALLSGLDEAAHARASARLTGTGVADHEAPVTHTETASEAAKRVNETWQRIEGFFAAHDPDRLDELGPPTAPQEAARCQRILGLTDEFAATLTRHRYVYIHERDLFYEDIPRILETCRRADGSYDVGDMAELGADDWEATYLSRLAAYADSLGPEHSRDQTATPEDT